MSGKRGICIFLLFASLAQKNCIRAKNALSASCTICIRGENTQSRLVYNMYMSQKHAGKVVYNMYTAYFFY